MVSVCFQMDSGEVCGVKANRPNYRILWQYICDFSMISKVKLQWNPSADQHYQNQVYCQVGGCSLEGNRCWWSGIQRCASPPSCAASCQRSFNPQTLSWHRFLRSPGAGRWSEVPPCLLNCLQTCWLYRQTAGVGQWCFGGGTAHIISYKLVTTEVRAMGL